jgi:hypothetical protein
VLFESENFALQHLDLALSVLDPGDESLGADPALGRRALGGLGPLCRAALGGGLLGWFSHCKGTLLSPPALLEYNAAPWL